MMVMLLQLVVWMHHLWQRSIGVQAVSWGCGRWATNPRLAGRTEYRMMLARPWVLVVVVGEFVGDARGLL